MQVPNISVSPPTGDGADAPPPVAEEQGRGPGAPASAEGQVLDAVDISLKKLDIRIERALGNEVADRGHGDEDGLTGAQSSSGRRLSAFSSNVLDIEAALKRHNAKAGERKKDVERPKVVTKKTLEILEKRLATALKEEDGAGALLALASDYTCPEEQALHEARLQRQKEEAEQAAALAAAALEAEKEALAASAAAKKAPKSKAKAKGKAKAKK
eukprot:TRINITY_DN73338_c0_g1_i1.p2 TRINITY_DN73338_c0_g1~~TRINITY_DN73338_c0_g1_i1.p2  ORF type:complete len:214 (+),score=77.56 TRINITY_DN73338_c0_g1_i1:306-947(+)